MARRKGGDFGGQISRNIKHRVGVNPQKSFPSLVSYKDAYNLGPLWMEIIKGTKKE